MNGFPKYRRRQTEPLRTIKGGQLDNRSVVPYNPVLLELLKCHVNVEACTFAQVVRRPYKSTRKERDRACLEHSRDEVSEYLDARYVGAPEAAWRLLEYLTHSRSHVVERLPVHLPGLQTVVFESGRETESVSERTARRTKLEAWFDLNANRHRLPAKVQALLKTLRYPDVPNCFSWKPATCSWEPRTKKRGTEPP